jgi:serine/threonine protein kinase
MKSGSSAPPEDPASSLPDDPRLVKAVESYLAELEAGRYPSRSQFLARYPDLQVPLAACLDGLELVHKAAGSSSGSQPSLRTTLGEIDFANADPLGDFRIIREIGRGGMGVVYEAFQLSLGRMVALKVLPFASALNPRNLQRFKNEAQAAAQLHHTNIVPVYAVGHERGVHFYAMQLIEGQSVSALIRDLRAQAGKTTGDQASSVRGVLPQAVPIPRPPRKPKSGAETVSLPAGSLSTQRSHRGAEYYRTAARLMVQAATALEHAHSFGVIHRDVKPANLLIDTRGNLWVTDFGLAQILADGQLTQSGDLVGTLAYMSPEQASGSGTPLDHRTDIYSLGATLYELLTLEPLFGGTNRPALLHRILNDEPVPPRALDRAIPIELETIILKAVNKNPADRYKTAQEMADDLQRFLDNKPILARRPAVVDRVRKWGRRHPSAVVAGVLLLVFSIAGLAVNNYMLAGEKRRTEVAYQLEQLRAEEADYQFRRARELVDVLIQICEEDLADKPFQQGLRRLILETALSYHKGFIDQRQDDKNAVVELATTQDRVNRILDELNVIQGMTQLNVIGYYPVVLSELKLSPEQSKQVDELIKNWEVSREQLNEEAKDSSSRETALKRRLRLLASAREGEVLLEHILTVEQRDRLGQLMLQFRGPGVFDDPAVIQRLQLTKDQRQRIRELEYASMRSLFGFGRPAPQGGRRGPEANRPPRQQYRTTGVEPILQVLTRSQLEIWNHMTGPLVEFKPKMSPPPPPRDRALQERERWENWSAITGPVIEFKSRPSPGPRDRAFPERDR